MFEIIEKSPIESIAVNAEIIDDQDLERLYVPNQKTGKSAFYRIAHPQKKFLLVADRGMGKTHILKLLRKRLKERNNIVIDISNYSPSVERTYYKLKEQYPSDRLSELWELAILELGCVSLLGAGFSPTSTWFYRDNALLFKYFEKYQPTELDNSKNFWKKQFKMYPEKSMLANVTLSIKSFFGEITAGVSRVAEAQIEEETPVTFADRHKLLSDWFWQTLQALQNQNEFKFKYQEEEGFPPVRSVFVIADGLDQGEESSNQKTLLTRPIKQDDLNSLISALKQFDTIAVDKLKTGPKNFKMVFAIRAITFAMSVNLKDLTQIRPNIEFLKWDRDSLKEMMAMFIREVSGNSIVGDTESVLAYIFPREVYYFGKKFDTGEDFLIEYTERRPREILLLWQDCTKASGNEDSLYTTQLSAQNLVDGLKDYSKKALPDDISNEYELEFPGIKELIDTIAEHYNELPRIVEKKQLESVINSFIQKTHNRDKKFWIDANPESLVKILYQTGIIGIPHGIVVNPDWPSAKFSDGKKDSRVEEATSFVFRPAFWNYLTDVEIETRKRRAYLLNLYEALRQETDSLYNIFFTKTDEKNFEMVLGRFLYLCDAAMNYQGYPEPVDWKIGKMVENGINMVYGKLVNTDICSNWTDLERMQGLFKRTLINTEDQDASQPANFVKYQVFVANTKKETNYECIMRSLIERNKRKTKKTRRVEQEKEFHACLMERENSLAATLGEAKDKVNALL